MIEVATSYTNLISVIRGEIKIILICEICGKKPIQ